MNKVEEIIDLLATYLLKGIKISKHNINKIYNKLLFNFNKKNTIKKMCEPIIEKRVSINENLYKDLNNLDKEEKIVLDNIKATKKEILALQKKIELMENILNREV